MKHPQGYLADACRRLEADMFPHEDGDEALTDVGRQRVQLFLAAFDEAAFNAGFDAAVTSILTPTALKTVRFDHPRYHADRRQQYRALRRQR